MKFRFFDFEVFEDWWLCVFGDLPEDWKSQDEKGNLVPVRITAYKASPNRNIDLSFSSDGDPAEITVEMSCLTNEDGDGMDIIEITE